MNTFLLILFAFIFIMDAIISIRHFCNKNEDAGYGWMCASMFAFVLYLEYFLKVVKP